MSCYLVCAVICLAEYCIRDAHEWLVFRRVLFRSRVVEKSRKIASALLECDVADVEISHGRLVVVGTDRSVSFQEVSHAAYFGWGQDSAVEYGLEEQVFFDPEGRDRKSTRLNSSH